MAPLPEPRPLREVVADEIRRMIAAGQIADGERLVEDRLAEQLGVSRNPVREAIRLLEVTGLVEVVPRRGAYVSTADLDAVAHLRELCLLVARWVGQAAAERADAADVARLDACIAEGRKAGQAGDLARASELRREFDMAVDAATKNPYTTITMAPLRQRAEMASSTTPRSTADRWDVEQGIRDAIAAGDAALAVRRIEEHIEDAFAVLGAAASAYQSSAVARSSR